MYKMPNEWPNDINHRKFGNFKKFALKISRNFIVNCRHVLAFYWFFIIQWLNFVIMTISVMNFVSNKIVCKICFSCVKPWSQYLGILRSFSTVQFSFITSKTKFDIKYKKLYIRVAEGPKTWENSQGA